MNSPRIQAMSPTAPLCMRPCLVEIPFIHFFQSPVHSLIPTVHSVNHFLFVKCNWKITPFFSTSVNGKAIAAFCTRKASFLFSPVKSSFPFPLVFPHFVLLQNSVVRRVALCYFSLFMHLPPWMLCEPLESGNLVLAFPLPRTERGLE